MRSFAVPLFQSQIEGGWYRRSVTKTNSVVVLNGDDLVAIHVGFFHRYGGGQFWRYYSHDDMSWSVVTWAKLSDEQRSRVLAAFYAGKAPGYAKLPGKLRSDRCTSKSAVRTTYKIVQVIDGRCYSVFDKQTEYILGKRLAQKAIGQHKSGYYSYPDLETLLRKSTVVHCFPKNAINRL